MPVLSAVSEEKSVAGGAANVATQSFLTWSFGRDRPAGLGAMTGEIELVQILTTAGISVLIQHFVFNSTDHKQNKSDSASNQQICRVDREALAENYDPGVVAIGEALKQKKPRLLMRLLSLIMAKDL